MHPLLGEIESGVPKLIDDSDDASLPAPKGRPAPDPDFITEHATTSHVEPETKRRGLRGELRIAGRVILKVLRGRLDKAIERLDD